MFRLAGCGSVLDLYLEHPIHLDVGRNYFLTLTSFHVKNSNLKNFDQTVHAVLYMPNGHDKIDVVFPSNQYSIKDIEGKLKDTYVSKLSALVDVNQNITYNALSKSEYYIRTNNYTNKVEMKLPLNIGLFPKRNRNSENLGYYLGFTPPEKEAYFQKDTTHIALHPPQMNAYNIIEIHCNLVSPTLANHKSKSHLHEEAQILHSFFPKAIRNEFDGTSCIAEVPAQSRFVPLSSHVKTIDHIRVDIRNEQDRLLNFTNGTVLCYLTLTSNESQQKND